MCLNIGTPKNINFPFGTNGKSMVLGISVLKHITVYRDSWGYFFLFLHNKTCPHTG